MACLHTTEHRHYRTVCISITIHYRPNVSGDLDVGLGRPSERPAVTDDGSLFLGLTFFRDASCDSRQGSTAPS